MDEQGLWRLFFTTGLPEVYLALHEMEREKEMLAGPPARTAFCPAGEVPHQI